MPFRSLLLCLAVIGTLETIPASAQQVPIDRSNVQPGVVITIKLVDGRLATGWVDEQTDNLRLWLRTETERVSLQSGFSWTDIVELTSGAPAGVVRIDSHTTQIAPLESILPQPLDGPAFFPDARPDVLRHDSQPISEERPTIASVRTLRISAVTMNWDQDADADGLEVLVQPLNSDWQVVPIAGNISFELLAELDPLTSSAGRSPRRRIQSLERWTVRLTPSDFESTGASVEIPFRRFQPDLDISVAPIGRLEGQLRLAGLGLFNAECFVGLRPPMPITVGEHVHDWENDQAEPISHLVVPMYGPADW